MFVYMQEIPQIILSLLLFIFLVYEVKLPEYAYNIIKEIYGIFIIFTVTMLLIFYGNNILGVLSKMTAFKILFDSYKYTSLQIEYVENDKIVHNSHTLEQIMIDQMITQ